MGGPTYADFIRRTTAYTREGIADRVTAPTLIMDAKDDQFLAGQPEMLQRAMTAPTTLARFTTAEGSGEHCHVGSLLRAHQVISDWLDTTVAARQPVDGCPAHRTDAGAAVTMEISILTPPGQSGAFTIGSREHGHRVDKGNESTLSRRIDLSFARPGRWRSTVTVSGAAKPSALFGRA
ncbi:MAG: dipeptidyl aminopeptidase [Mycobacterium sp.]|jgi:hypothetical protein|nr:dipeptidyl aminopeptidase [Mycobacterium sp.]